MLTAKRWQYAPIFNLAQGEVCHGCKTPILPTVYGPMTLFVLDTVDDRAYHGACAPEQPKTTAHPERKQ